MVKFVRPTQKLIEQIAADMRQSDVDEVWASHRHTPLQSLTSAMSSSDYRAVVVAGGVPIAALGLRMNSYLSDEGVPWLLSTNEALKHKREFLANTAEVISDMLMLSPRLVNYVHANNKLSIRWLKWIGFTIDEPAESPVSKELFHKFHMTKVL